MPKPSINTRVRAQVRPTWDASLAVAANSEQFTNISLTLGQILTIPGDCTGFTVVARDPSVNSALFVYMGQGRQGFVTTGAAGTVLNDALAAFDVGSDQVTVGDRVANITDGSIGEVTAVTSGIRLDLAGGLSGGAENDFDRLDAYAVMVLTGPRFVIDGGDASKRGRYFPIEPELAPPARNFVVYLLTQNANVDADVFYHFD